MRDLLTMMIRMTNEDAMRYLKPLGLITRSAAAFGIDTTNLVPTQEEVHAADAREQQMAMDA